MRPVADQPACFIERDPDFPLWRRAAAEGFGTFLLVLVIAASFAGTCCLPAGPAMVARGFSIAATLAGLIVAFGPVSGGHFNPLITACQWFERRRKTSCLIAYLCAQLLGGALGALTASAVFGAVGWAPQGPAPALSLLVAGEALGTAGLMTIVLAVSRAAPPAAGPFAVAGWVLATLLVIPTIPFCNPAVAIAAMAGRPLLFLTPQSASAHVAAEVAGALVALAVVGVAYPLRNGDAARRPRGGPPC